MKTFNTATDTPKRQFHFEGNLPHQVKAVASIANVFENIDFMPVAGLLKDVANPQYTNNPNAGNENSRLYYHALQQTRQRNQIFDDKSLKTDCLVQSLNTTCRVLDIAMETGTGKTYTYTKAMFALNQQKGIFKFIVIVPTLAIKAGTINFLKSTACQEHFALTYGQKRLHCHLLDSQKNSKSKKNNAMPQAIVDFVQAQNDGQSIHVLIMNAGMINSPTLKQSFDRGLFDQFTVPFDGIASVAPFIIIDEPHRFPTEKKTWENIQLFSAQFILRFGATFNHQYENLIYRLSSIDAFNQNLVKGVLAYVENFAEGQNISLKLLDTDGTEARFELSHQGHKKQFTLAKNDSLSQIHPEMQHLHLENLNKSIVILSNGLELKRGDIINPYSYAQSLQFQMVQKAIAKHFELEKEYFTQHSPRIKPLTLFFIDAIESYRGKDGQQGELSAFVEQHITAHAQRLLATETNADYRVYLQKTLDDVSRTHGGYFSKDNSDSDEKVETEINEILHDKESLLDLNNPRRFIFSKWTLREGWDNPNVFQICKIRSSGSQTSKLQEVGRGLRLPVNEYMQRITDKDFYLHYYVDFSEADFAEQLINEINQSAITDSQPLAATELSDELIAKVLTAYPNKSEDEIAEHLLELGATNARGKFKDGGFALFEKAYPNCFNQPKLDPSKVKTATATPSKTKTKMRIAKFEELRELWESINQKVILQYDIDNEEQFYTLLMAYFKQARAQFKTSGVSTIEKRVSIQHNLAVLTECESIDDDILPISTLTYRDFLVELANSLKVNMLTLHKAFVTLHPELNINLYLSRNTIRHIKSGFEQFLLAHSFAKFSVCYQAVSNTVHPTYFTDATGRPLAEVDASRLGIKYSSAKPADSYLFTDVFYDSDLEQENITSNIKGVTVFSKIPKNSIKIPVAGGSSYSPDFAYVVDYANGSKRLNLVVESKNKDDIALNTEEVQKIKHAEQLFSQSGQVINIQFKKQLKQMSMVELIKDIIQQSG